MASFMAVMATIAIKGTALRPGLEPPNMGKIWEGVSRGFASRTGERRVCYGDTYNQNYKEKEKYVGDILELEPQVLWNE